MKKFIGVIITAVVLCILCALSGCVYKGNSGTWSDIDYNNERAYTVGGGEVSANITEIEINWIEEGIEVKYDGGDKLKISESVTDDTIPEKLKLRYLVVGQKLTIQFATNGRHDIRGLHKSLTVIIPSGTQLDKLSIDSVSGNVTADVDVKEFDVDIVSGNVTASNVIRRADVDTTSGTVKLYTGNVTNLDIESVSGNINLYVPEDLGFTLYLDSVSGEFNSSLATTQKGDRYTRLGGGASINVESVSGDVTVDKK